MTETRDDTAVVIIGAGVAGLTLGNFLPGNGVGCIVLEKHPRAYVEKRQRAGTIDTFGVRLFRDWDLEEVLAGDPIPHSEGGFYIAGHAMPIDVDEDNNESL
ncbi:FAD-dependent monooxygenase [Streptomyces sp. NPDC026673]|uniref:FAD-dependent monooxygenase n=1 Tax=Streptomyces sp. NPDC026673 TaxID=3155724 RepID=UPI0033E0EF2F